MEKNYFSKEKHEELVRELEDCRTSKRREVAERLEYAQSLGDLSENAEYHAAREEQAEIEERIGQLEMLLKNAEIIVVHQSNAVDIGSTVLIKKIADNAENRFIIVGSEESDVASGKISYQSPLGAALLGKKAGEKVTVNTPRGSVEYQITKVQ